MKSGSLLFLFAVWLSAQASAAEFKDGRVTRVIKDVQLLPEQAASRPAAVNDEVRGGTAVRTGADSRSELKFSDLTIARLGSNTIFSLNEGARTIDLDAGAVLLRVPKGSGGATIKTAAVTAAITGTTVMAEYHPNVFKFIMLEGTAKITRPGHPGESVTLQTGEMLSGDPNKPLEQPVTVDLERVTESSLLLRDFGRLGSEDLIEQGKKE
nr:FecR domain-containing protein [Chthoniobacterales bacterium]